MIRHSFITLLHEASYIQRWNDHIRPGDGFTELDKQSHKMFFSYILSKCEVDKGNEVDFRLLIEGGIFEYLHRVILTDIKPPIFHELMNEKGEQLNKWVLKKLEKTVSGVGSDFYNKFENYLLDKSYGVHEKKVLRAAHFLATQWEFKIIRVFNASLYGIDEVEAEIDQQMEQHYDLYCVKQFSVNSNLKKFMEMVAKLRFQRRWSQQPRYPQTSVIGHSFIVAVLSYLCSVQIESCDKRVVNNFFAGLFHDLPETLTRDIVSPVKNSVEGLDELIKGIENVQLHNKLLPLLPLGWHFELEYYINDEFDSKICVDDKISRVASEEISKKYNEDCFSPIDGQIIRGCDHFAAYIEAALSVQHGIVSKTLKDAINGLCEKYENKVIAGINFGQLFDYFK